MQLTSYQDSTHETAVYRETNKTERDRINYVLHGLVGEAGELSNKWKKYLRGDKDFDTVLGELFDEAGDVLWYLARLAHECGYDLNSVANANLKKLSDRMERGVIRGSGDNR